MRGSQHHADSTLLAGEEWSLAGTALHLSGRELQIVRAVFDNRTQLALAADLGMSRHTANTHLERLYHKLHVNTRVALVLRVMEIVLHRG
jgi:DNA-binding CsgD family transcriptional regulator